MSITYAGREIVKRFYLCKLFPLGEIDDEKLDVDWATDRAREGDNVELRVLIHELPLNIDDPDFDVQFEINKNDFLLSGGLDDHVLTIQGPTRQSDEAEERAFKVIAPDTEPPEGDERLRHIFISRPSLQNTLPRTLLRCFWKAKRQNDASSDPEYYFNFILRFSGDERSTRSDRRLTVLTNAGGFGLGLGLRPSERDRAVQLREFPQPVVRAAGWSQSRVSLGESVELIAIVEGGRSGQPITFEILSNAREDAEVYERIDSVIEADGVQRVKWTPPRPFPLDNVTVLFMRCYVVYLPEHIAYSKTASLRVGTATLELSGRLELEADLQIEVLDADGRSLKGVSYRLEMPDGSLLAQGTVNAEGLIAVPKVAGERFHLLLQEVALLDAYEPNSTERPADATGGVVFSVVQLHRPTAWGFSRE